MRILFIHKNYPAQFGAWGTWLAARGHDVTFATERTDARSDRIRIVTYTPHRDPTPKMHHYLVGTEAAVLASQAMVRTGLEMKAKGYTPDVIVAHSGWGGGTFLKEIWPKAAYIPYFEWYYRWPSVDGTPHDDPGPDTLDRAMRCHGRNLPFLMDFAAADAVICPTEFQASQFPDWMRARITVSRDGFDTALDSPGPRSTALLDELAIPHDAPVVTWVTRGMEPARGFPEMMAAMADLMAARPDLHMIVVGEDRVAYGAKAGDSWKARMLAEYGHDRQRMHFTGLVSRRRLVDILRTGHVHLYLTAPFVLSWSCLDAMACGALLVASDCAPVREFVTDGENGLLAPTYDHDGLVARLGYALDNRDRLAPLRQAARACIVSTMDAETVAYPARTALLQEIIANRA